MIDKAIEWLMNLPGRDGAKLSNAHDVAMVSSIARRLEAADAEHGAHGTLLPEARRQHDAGDSHYSTKQVTASEVTHAAYDAARKEHLE